MQEIVQQTEAVATLDAALLILGETGVGKSQLARWIHTRSDRAQGPFRTVNLHAIPDGLMEAQLFGATKGAYTSAQGQRGILAEAETGTLFVDEIDKLSKAGQASLLSVLDDGTYRQVGESRVRNADVRFLFGTNADLWALVHSGAFLKDLYYRINVLPVALPPLRRRRGDIAPWADLMMQVVSKGKVCLEASAHARLGVEDWPGNLRELNSVVQRAGALVLSQSRSVCTGSDVERALGLDAGRSISWLEPMDEAASWVAAARSRDSPLGLRIAGAFEARVLLLADSRYGREHALTLLGKQGYVKSNPTKPIRKAKDVWDALTRVLIESADQAEKGTRC
jgi:DNA-binding NtrC family response regulator